MNDDINEYLPSLLNPRQVKKQDGNLSLTQNSFVSRTSLSLKRNTGLKFKSKCKILPTNKENSQNVQNFLRDNIVHTPTKTFKSINPKNILISKQILDKDSIGTSAIDDLQTIGNNLESSSVDEDLTFVETKVDAISLISVSSNTELDDAKSDTTVIYNVTDKPTISVSFGIIHCQSVDINSKNSAIKRIHVSHDNNNTQVDCEIVENSKVSTVSDLEENMDESLTPNSLKRSAVTVNLEIKKKKPSNLAVEEKVLILNTSAIEKISHVIVQPPNYKIVKGKRLGANKLKASAKRKSVIPSNNGKVCEKLSQKSIDSFFPKRSNTGGSNIKVSDVFRESVTARAENKTENDEVMSCRISGFPDGIKSDRSRKSPYKGSIKHETSVKSRLSSPRKEVSSRLETRKVESPSCHSARKQLDSIQFNLPSKSVSAKRSVTNKVVPQYKIVAGTNFAVDAFSYGDIPNVKHYFLTHFHSDHYTGLKKSFNKSMFCSKITADLCVSRLGVNPNCINIISVDESITVDDIEITAIEANHCPGAVMLVFTLSNGRSVLHTGDFRAAPPMESYPIFWNRNIHTVYLDTTYCNPQYDFPTQEESLEMALYILREKKMAMEKAGKKFSSVLIVCGTYTIGKEKFFLGVSRRVGCGVWACADKERVLRAVQPRVALVARTVAQLHVVPMRDLTHEKLRAYLDSLNGAFSEIVAFKPSGWENGKSTSVEKDMVTIHGIPYSEHSSFSELVRFIKFLRPKQVIPTVDISGGVKAVQKYFPCPLVYNDDVQSQSKLTDFFSIQNQRRLAAVT